MNDLAYFTCIKCKKNYPLTADIFTCPNHSQYYSFLYINYHYDTIYGFIKSDSICKYDHYLPLLPVSSLGINFNEVKTPLIRAKNLGTFWGIKNLYIKDEGKNPAGSFKDRESIIAVNSALEMGIGKLLVVSSGNGAVSTAAYAKKADMECLCVVPKDLSVGKRFLLSLYGAKIMFQEGSYEKLYKNQIDKPIVGYWNVTPGYNPFRDEGVKTIGFEIWEDIGVPDIIVAPCGNGTLLFAIYKAFREMNMIGLAKKMPVMIGVQIKGGAPLSESLKRGSEYEVITHPPESIAEGIIASESFSSPKALFALKDTGGMMIEVTDSEIKKTLKEVIRRESIIPEPTSAAVFAGLAKIGDVGGRSIVVVNTATGFKNLKEIMESMINISSYQSVTCSPQVSLCYDGSNSVRI